ncbi:MAG: TolC family protein, partial [Pirellulaceae bacterium]|nr:TolC family protein [Pirellulaceae bacterium]
MKRQLVSVICLVALALNGLPGCMLRNPGHRFGGDLAHLGQVADQTHYGDVHQAADGSLATMGSPPPRLLTDLTPADFWPMTPEEAVQLAVINSPVLRDLGGTVLRQPPTLRSVYDPALVETNPGRATNIPGAGTTSGVPAALSFFDAEFSTRAFFEKNDRAFNNRIVGLGTQIFQQDFINWQSELKKRSMTGGQYTFRKTWEYDANNSMDNVFGSAWGTLMDFEVRQPLFQGRGVDFNQIAGPDGLPGQMNGVRVARLNTDLAVTEYQIGLRDLVSNVENAYWDLYYAYRDLEAKIAARDEALQIWQELKVGGGGGPAGAAPPDVAAQIAQASEQYFRFQEQVQNALNGKLIQGTQVNNGSLAGTFRAVPGVLVAERRLRLAIGLPINDSRVIRPAHDPKMVRVVFNWDEVLNEALTRRSELQRQRTVIRRSELELLANRNFLLPRLDAFGRYRFRGLGKQLIDSRRTNPGLTDINGNPVDRLSFDNAYQDLTTGDFQEWQLGFEFALPIGFRRAHAAVRHSQLQLARERAVLNEQERQLVHDLSNSYAEVHRAFEVLQTAFNRRLQARQNVDALEVVRETGEPIDTNLRLDAQRRLADAESGFYAAFAEYMVAIKNVHFEKGSLLDYNEV